MSSKTGRGVEDGSKHVSHQKHDKNIKPNEIVSEKMVSGKDGTVTEAPVQGRSLMEKSKTGN